MGDPEDNLALCEPGKADLRMRSATWNLAAVNNNPFEYWITFHDPNYDKLLEAVENFLCDSDRDLRVDQIFNDKMFSELTAEMEANGIGSLDKLRQFWENDYKPRLAIGGFLKDKAIGTKRLSSMPDRITNSINLSDGSIFRRPSAISAYKGPSIGSVELWWEQWKIFMFHSDIHIFKHGENAAPQKVCNLLSPILRSKYPAISVEEQEISIQLQLLCLAILDAIFIFILSASGPSSWESVRETLCNSLIFNKASATCEIIAQSYSDTAIFFIQEAAAIFTQKAGEHELLSRKYFIISPPNLDGKRNQNSLILLDRTEFVESSQCDVTQLVVDILDGVFITAGDLLAVTVRDATGHGWLLVSFHGDSNGLSAQPVLAAVLELARGRCAGHLLLCGIDANTYSGPADRFFHHVESFSRFIAEHGLVSLWGDRPDPAVRTTFSCRTYLQTQLNKAVPMAARFSQKNHNLKDWIVAFASQVTEFVDVQRDNTGRRRFAPDTVLPSVDFPSDHVVVSAAMVLAPLSPAPAQLPQHSPTHGVATPSVRGSNSACSHGRRRSICQDRVSGQKTLYDYWGIGEKPLASTRLQQACEAPTLSIGQEDLHAVIAPGSAEMEAQVGDLRTRLYRRLVGKDRSGDYDHLSMLMSTREDRSIWIPFGPRPTSMAMCKTWFQLLVSSAGVAFLAETACNIWFVATQASAPGSAFRFVAVTTRDGAPVPSSALGVQSVGLLQSGVVRLQRGGQDAVGGSVVLNLTSEHPIDGFFIQTGGGDPALDPQEYRWERWDDAEGWQRVRYPAWMPRGNVVGLPTERMAARVIDFRPPASWLANRVLCLALLSITMIASAICGALHKPDLAVLVYAVPYHLSFVSTIWQVVTYASMAEVGGGILALSYALHSITHLCYGSNAYYQRYQVDLLLISSSGYCAASILIYYKSFLFDDYPWLNWLIIASVVFSPALCSVFLIAVRSLTWSWVLRTMTKPDKQAFDRAWDEVLANDRASQSLGRLGSLCDSLHVTHCAVHRISWPTLPGIMPPKAAISCRRTSMPRHVMAGRRLMSLDQLYDQAVCLEFFLRQKVLSFAQGSNGCFQVQSSSDPEQDVCFASWTEITTGKGSGSGALIRWAEIKYPERALEKLIRTYDCDVSRLVDCCRESLYFREPADLAACFEVIAADKEVSIRRVKNRMDPSFDTTRSGGFRCVSINLCIESDETRKLGVDGHVCELLLVLTSFARLVDENEHDRYLVLRNCRDAPFLYKALAFHTLRPRWPAWSQCFKISGFRRSSVVFPSMHDCESLAADALDGGNVRACRKPSCSSGYELESDGSSAPKAMSLEDQCGSVIERCVHNAMKASHRRFDALRDFVAEEAMEGIGVRGCTMWTTPHPLAAALFRPPMKWMIALFMAANVADIAYVGFVSAADDQTSGMHFRFTALQLRDSSRSVRAPGISNLGVFCKEDRQIASAPPPHNASSMNQSFTISFATPVTADGWWFETTLAPSEDDPVRFYLESSEDGVHWVKVGSSGTVWTWSGGLHWTDGPFDTSMARQTRVMFEASVPWVWVASHVLNSIIYIFMGCFLLVSKAKKNVMMARVIIAHCSCATFVVFASQFAICAAWAQAPMAITAGVQATSLLAFSSVVFFKESRSILAIGFCGAVWVLNVVVHHTVLVGEPAGLLDRTSVFSNQGLWSGVCLLGIFGMANTIRWHTWARSTALVSEDLRRYDACWQAILRADQPHAHLQRLDQRVSEISSSKPADVRQRIQPDQSMTPIRSASSSLKGGKPAAGSDLGEGPLVHSLDQLFTQATVADVLLRDKVKAWSLESRGLAIVASEREKSFLPWSEVVADQQKLKQVRFAALKTRRRAVEKVYRHCGGDVSRLLDVCRQSIYFRGPDDLRDCLGVLAADPEARIRHASSSMRPGRDAEATLGFRYVLVHLSLRSALARRLGVDTHVCELQLVLVSFAEALTDAAHARYVQWKDQRSAEAAW